jgi:biopolymer transport protein ExbD/biopolymer transport protein TolR
MARRARRHRYELNADVNVVSLIDVMLLLLVIFMITAPLMQGGVDVQLPEADAKPLESKSGAIITVNSSGVIYLDGQRLSLGEFRSAIGSVAANLAKDGVYLRVDRGVPYGTVVQLMAMLQSHGITNIGIVTQQEDIR